VAQRIASIVVLILLLEIFPARAQIPLQYPIELPGPFVREALDQPYGRALITEFAKTVAQGADTACLQSKALDEGKLRERGRDLFQHYGTQSMETIIKNVDVRRAESKIVEHAGPKAAGELMRLRGDPTVKKYLALERPARLARVIGFVVENLDHYVLLNRIKLKSFSPVATGNDELMRINPTEAAEEAMEKFVNDNKSRQFKRFYELSEVAGTAFIEAFNREVALKWGPNTFFRGVENDLAEICVTGR